MHIKLNLTNISNFMLPNFTFTFEGFNLTSRDPIVGNGVNQDRP
jgi:hypothetical protein